MGPMWSSSEIGNLIGSVVIKILGFGPKSFTSFYEHVFIISVNYEKRAACRVVLLLRMVNFINSNL